ncbi:MAG: hypothetical protein U1F51_19550 [Burkholderiales bacterium]
MKRTLSGAVLALGLAFAANAPAALHHWNLTGVAFDDGTPVTGSFTFDDATGTVVMWNVTVQAGAQYLPFTYMPGDSVADVNIVGPYTTVVFSSVEAGYPHEFGVDARQLRLTPTLPLSSATSPNPIDVVNYDNHSGGLECYNCGGARVIVSGALTAGAPPVSLLAQAVEFYHAGLDHYFLTSDANEILVLDTGVLPGWVRTGQAFTAFAPGSPNAAPVRPVCRYYGLPSAGLASHFYSADPAECLRVRILFPDAWQIEAGNVFQILLPDRTSGACPIGTQPVFRVFNNRADANHRYMTSLAIRAQMEEAGWVREGYGPDATMMCAVGPGD